MSEASEVSQEVVNAPKFSPEMLDLFNNITYMMNILEQSRTLKSTASFIALIETSVETLSKIEESPAFIELCSADPAAMMVFVLQLLSFLKGSVYACDLLLAKGISDIENIKRVRQMTVDFIAEHKDHPGYNPEMATEEMAAVEEKLSKWDCT